MKVVLVLENQKRINKKLNATYIYYRNLGESKFRSQKKEDENAYEMEEAVAVKFGFKKDPSKRKTIRYKQINNLKKKFRVLASKLIKEEDV